MGEERALHSLEESIAYDLDGERVMGGKDTMYTLVVHSDGYDHPRVYVVGDEGSLGYIEVKIV